MCHLPIQQQQKDEDKFDYLIVIFYLNATKEKNDDRPGSFASFITNEHKRKKWWIAMQPKKP